ncbi:MAG: hypothetical protein AAF223_03550 [Bacteroidota bacterium]
MEAIRNAAGQFKTTKGRPKGSKNHTPARVKNFCLKLFNKNLDNMQEDLNQLPPEDRVTALIEIGKLGLD